MRVLLADDHAVLRQALAQLLTAEPDMEIVGEAADGEAAVAHARALRPDAILMDVRMPKLDGIAATRAIHAEFPDVCIIGLSAFERDAAAAAMLEAGAYSFIVKGESCEVFLQELRACFHQVRDRLASDRRAA